MKNLAIPDKCYSAGRVEAALLLMSVICAIASVFIFLNHGWALGVLAVGITVAIYAISRMIDLATDALILVDRLKTEQSSAATDSDAAN